MPILGKRAPLHIALLLTLAGGGARAQDAQLGPSCNLGAVGVTDAKGFLAFDRELRAALSKQDALTMAVLVTYPLRVNDDRGVYSLDEPAALQSHFQEVFPAPIRAAAIDQKTNEFFCNAEGIMYGHGDIWVEPTAAGYAIKVINLPPHSPAPASRIEFVCNADKHRIVIDTTGVAVRYRAWNKPHLLSEKPDLEIPAGKAGVEGTGSCSYRVWTFDRGGTEYTVSGLGGCGPASDQARGARGTLDVTVGGKSVAHSWCY